jgi:putative hemolysin
MIWIILSIVIIILLIIISAFFSSAEMAFVSINKAVVVDKARKGEKKAQILEDLLLKPDNVINAVVIGNNIVNIFASVLSGYVATQFFGNIGIGIATATMTLLILVFSESTPKAYGIQNERFALRIARPLKFVTLLFHPLVITLNYVSQGILKLFGRQNHRNTAVTEDEIMAMMRLGEEEGTIEKDEREMVTEVFEFDETRAYEIYTPKDKVEFIHVNDSIDTLIDKAINTGFSRFPVYEKNLDDVIGMVHVKDTLIVEDTSIPIRNIMRDMLKISSNMKADDVVREMKRQKTHLALLQDPQGKTLGLVSMEDLIEEIFGEIADEHDVKDDEEEFSSAT